MRRPAIIFASVLLTLPAGAALAGPHYGIRTAPTVFPIEHEMASAQASAQADRDHGPYAMTYSEEAAQSLGISGGRWEAFDTGPSTTDPLLPALNGGVDHGGAMIRLQWR